MSQDPRYPSSSHGMSGSMGSESDMGRSGNMGSSDGSAMTMDQQHDSESNFSEKASDTASMIQDQAAKAGSKLQDQADMGIDKAAGGLESAAEQMRGRFEDKGGMQGQMGTKVADSLEKTAGYLRDHEADQIWQDVENFVKDHPIQSAAGAAVAGFVIARVLR